MLQSFMIFNLWFFGIIALLGLVHLSSVFWSVGKPPCPGSEFGEALFAICSAAIGVISSLVWLILACIHWC